MTYLVQALLWCCYREFTTCICVEYRVERCIQISKFRHIEISEFRCIEYRFFDISNIEVSIYRTIEHVLTPIPLHPCDFYADTERKLRCTRHQVISDIEIVHIDYWCVFFRSISCRTPFSFDIEHELVYFLCIHSTGHLLRTPAIRNSGAVIYWS